MLARVTAFEPRESRAVRSGWGMVARRSIVSVLALTLIGAITVTAFRQASPSASGDASNQNELIEQRVVPQLEYLFQKLVAEKRETAIDGTRAFSGGDRFLPGQIALGLSLVLVNTPRSDPRFAAYLAGYRDIADMTVDDVNETWGIYHHMSTYFPIPYSHRLVQGSPNADYPQLLPKFSLADGAELMPLVYIDRVELNGNVLSYQQAAFDRLGGKAPVKDERLTSQVRFELLPASIRRVEVYQPAAPLDIRRISLEFASFSEQPQVERTRIRFGRGGVTELNIEGLQTCEASQVEPGSIYKASHGAMKTVVRCHSESVRLEQPFTIVWTLTYR